MSDLRVNIDKPWKFFTVHQPDCIHVRKVGSKKKYIGSLGENGGWFEVSDESAARQLHNEIAPNYSFIYCKFCFK